MDTAAVTRREWIERIERMRAAWDELAAAALVRGAELPGAMGEWSVKDAAAHLNGWRALTVLRLEAAADGGSPAAAPWPGGETEETPETVDIINEWINEQGQAQSIDDLLATASEQFERMRAAVERLSADQLSATPVWLDGEPVWAVIDGSLEHLHVDHEPEIRAWLAQSGMHSGE